MVEEYDFSDPQVRASLGLPRRPLLAARTGLLSLVLSLASLSAPEPERPWTVHQGVEIHASVPPWSKGLSLPDESRAREATRFIMDELDRYPSGFVASTCALERIYVVSGSAPTSIPGLEAGAQYSSDTNSYWVTVDRDPHPIQFEYDIRKATVHEIDHACNMTLRTPEQVEAWEAYVDLPGELTLATVEANLMHDDRPAPPGFANWYAASTAFTDDGRLRHVEDEASIKELITYRWHVILALNDPIIDAKVDLLIDRYEGWSGGVMDREYFENWHVPFTTLE